MGKFEILRVLSQKQNGVVTRAQLLEKDIHSNVIDRLITQGTLIKTRRGVYIVAGSQNTWLQRAAVATYSCGVNARLSHESVLQLYGLIDFTNDTWYRRRRPEYTRHLIHVVNPRRDYRDNEVFFHRSVKFLDTDHNNYSSGIPHVSLERALIDCSQQLTDHELSYCVDRCLKMQLTTIKRLKDALKVLRSGPGRQKKRIQAVVQDMQPGAYKRSNESIFEKRVEDVVSRYSVYELQRQYLVRVASKNFRLDFAIPELMIAIEADGYQFHAHRSAFDEDRTRTALLMGAGWNVLHLSTAMSDDEIVEHFLNLQQRLSR